MSSEIIPGFPDAPLFDSDDGSSGHERKERLSPVEKLRRDGFSRHIADDMTRAMFMVLVAVVFIIILLLMAIKGIDAVL